MVWPMAPMLSVGRAGTTCDDPLSGADGMQLSGRPLLKANADGTKRLRATTARDSSNPRFVEERVDDLLEFVTHLDIGG